MQILLVIIFLSAQAFSFEGDVEQDQVKAAVSAHSNEIRICYRENQKSLKGATGKIYIDFEVNDQGVLVKSDVNAKKTTLKNEALVKCMSEKFKTWVFPSAPKGTTVKVIYPFAFSKN